ncbi:MAG: CSLREA domain-containing protein [Gammaproteobacteria bacterium]
MGLGDQHGLAATFTVNSPSDVNDASPGNGICETAPGNAVCTLRAAIQEANALTGNDIINLPALPPPNAYVLTLGAVLEISSNLIINGGGAATTIIDGNGSLRPTAGVLRIAVAGIATISGVAARNGSFTFGTGGIQNDGTLTLSRWR